MDKTRTIGQKWLANDLDRKFLIIRECIPNFIQSVNSFESYRAHRQTTDRQIRKNHFFVFSGSQNVEI